MRLRDKTALTTGGASGLGLATGSVVQVDGGFGVRGLGRGRLGDGLDQWSAGEMTASGSPGGDE